MYVQRYMQHFPAAGEVVIFDRSWYNRAGIERVMGFCTDEEVQRFLAMAPTVEKAMVDSGILLVKYWLEVGPGEQTRRLESRIDDPRKIWKLSEMDLLSYAKWDDYSRARDEMFAATDTAWAPWFGRAFGRQEARPPQRDLPPARPDSVRAAPAEQGRLARAEGPRPYRRVRDSVALCPDEVLTPVTSRFRVA